MSVMVSLLMMLLLAAAVYSFMMLYAGTRQPPGVASSGRLRGFGRIQYAIRAVVRLHTPRKLWNYFMLFWICIALELIALAIQISIYKSP